MLWLLYEIKTNIAIWRKIQLLEFDILVNFSWKRAHQIFRQFYVVFHFSSISSNFRADKFCLIFPSSWRVFTVFILTILTIEFQEKNLKLNFSKQNWAHACPKLKLSQSALKVLFTFQFYWFRWFRWFRQFSFPAFCDSAKNYKILLKLKDLQ